MRPTPSPKNKIEAPPAPFLSPSLRMSKFPVKVYTMNGLGYDSTHDYYDMTEEELENKCCILECRIYFKDTVANSYKCLINERYVTLYDIWNYECTPWWEWPQEMKDIMYKKVPKSRPVV